MSSRKSSRIARKEKGDKQKDPMTEKEDPFYWVHSEVRKVSSLVDDVGSIQMLCQSVQLSRDGEESSC